MERKRFQKASYSPAVTRSQKKIDHKPKLMVYGVHPVMAALTSPKSVDHLLLQEGESARALKEIFSKARERDVRVERVPSSELEQVSHGGNHQGVVAFLREQGLYKDISALEKGSLVLLLDHLEDPQNFGAILRTAHQMNVDAVVIPKHHSAGITPGVLKASSGAALEIPIIQHSSLIFVLEKLKSWGYWIYSTRLEGGLPLPSVEWSQKVALIVGNESRGVSDALQKKADFFVSIPTYPSSIVDSLNVSVATAICLYEIMSFRTNH